MIRVLHLRTDVGNNAWNLCNVENELGINSHMLVVNPSKFGFPHEYYWFDDKLSYINMMKKRISYYKDNIDKYDVFHFNFGLNLLPPGYIFLELLYLKMKHKVICVTWQGSDSRDFLYCRKNYKYTCYKKDSGIKINVISWFSKKVRIFAWNTFANTLYATNPDLFNTLPKRTIYRPYTKINLDNYKPHYSNYSDSKPLTIIHAPSNRLVKGTEYIVKTIDRLKDEGYKINFILIEDVKNDEALELYKNADLVIDQLFIGFYGGFAVECMAYGKPVVCYIRESDLKYIPKEMKNDLPVINANIDNLYDVIKKYLINKTELEEIAINSRKYVEKWHNNETIAQGIIENYMKEFRKTV